MKYLNSTVTYFLAAIICIVTISGCLDANGTEYTSRVQFGMEFENFDSTLTSADDSISIDQFRFVYGDGTIGFNDSTATVLEDEADWQEYGVNSTSSNPFLLFNTSHGTYDSFVLSVQRAPEDNSNISSVFTSGGRYSMIIEGTYNGLDFTFKSSRAFKDTLNISPVVEVPETNAQYLFLVTTDVRMWFSKPGGGYYDPSDDENTGSINDQIEGSFTLDVQNNE